MNHTQPTVAVSALDRLDAAMTAVLPPGSLVFSFLTFYRMEMEEARGDLDGPEMTIAEALTMLNEPDGMAALIRVATVFQKAMTK